MKATSRRNFLSNSAKVAGVLPFLGSQVFLDDSKKEKRNSHGPMKILILGGTSFLGPHQIAAALKNGHEVSTFTRGKTIPSIHKDLFKNVEQLIGDREDNLEALKGRKWDIVFDNSGRKVQWTTDTAELLKDHVDHYFYISSVSAYYPYYDTHIKEDQKLVLKIPEELEDENEKYMYEYGVMKANSEMEVMRIFGEDRSYIIRPTFMVGPGDQTDRFMYYPTQLAKGGDIILPGKERDQIQYIDIRDISKWMIHLAEKGRPGAYNAAGPGFKMNMKQFVYGAHAAFNTPVNFIKMDDYDFLEKHEFRFQAPWILDTNPKFAGISNVDISKILDSGIEYRPLADTIKDTHDWWYSDAVTEERRTNFLQAEQSMVNRQEALIKAWNEHVK